MTGASDMVNFLARTPRRSEILDTLHRESLDLRSLSDELDVPRTTLRDNLDSMQKIGWVVENDDREYETTTLGAIVVTKFREYRRAVEVADELQPFLEQIPICDLELDVSRLEGATMTRPKPALPQAPDRKLSEHFEDADEIRALSSIVVPMAFRNLHERVTEEMVEAELVVTPTVSDVFRTTYEEWYHDFVDSQQVALGVTEELPPFGVAIVDDTVLLQALDANDRLCALVETTNEECRAWAERFFESRYEQSVALSAIASNA